MKQTLILLLVSLCIANSLEAQVKIGDNPQNIDPASVLELESTDKVLVITRVTTAQMNAITPLQGAMVYNTEVQAVHYYDGTQWVNIGSGGGADGTHTADGLQLVNGQPVQPTIVITPTATGNNFEVLPNSIGTEQIKDGSIKGEDLDFGSLDGSTIIAGTIGSLQLGENSVTTVEIDRDLVPISFFINDAGFVTSANIVSGDADNVLQVGGDNGAFYDDSPLVSDIMDTDQKIDDHIAADDDLSDTNEIQVLGLNANEITLSNGGGSVTLPSTTEEVDDILLTGVGTNMNPFTIKPGDADQILRTNAAGDAVAWVDLPPGGGDDNQTAAEVPFTATGNTISTDVQTAIVELQDEIDTFSAGAGQSNTTSNQGIAGVGLILAKNAADLPFKSINSSISGIITVTDDTANNEIDLDIADNSITADKLNAMGADETGQILQWNTTLNSDAGGWEVAVNSGHLGNTQNNVFFAGPGGIPHDTESNDGAVSATRKDNGGFFWDSSKRFNTGALYLGLKLNGASETGPLGESAIGDHSKLVVTERLPAAEAFPLQLVNEGDVDGTGTGILFANDVNGDEGGAALIYERVGTQGDFHFLSNTVDVRPTYADKILTIENDGDLKLFGGIDINGTTTGTGFGTAGQVLSSTGTGLLWVNNGGLPLATANDQVVTWAGDDTNTPELEGAWAAGTAVSNEQDIALDAANDEIDLLESDGTTVSSSIKLDGVTLEAFDNNTATNVTDDVIRIKPAAPLSTVPADQKKQILVTSPDGTSLAWEESRIAGLIQKGKGTTDVNGEVMIPIPNQANTDYVINLTVRGFFNNRPYTIQVSDQQTNSFTALVYELDPATTSFIESVGAIVHYTVFSE